VITCDLVEFFFDDLVEFFCRERVKILEKDGDDGVSVWILATGLNILRTQRQLTVAGSSGS